MLKDIHYVEETRTGLVAYLPAKHRANLVETGDLVPQQSVVLEWQRSAERSRPDLGRSP